jgi:outer membrane protein insertion porin family
LSAESPVGWDVPRCARRPRLALALLGVAGLLAALAPPAALAQAQPDEPVLAVLPFQVHSAKPLDYLGESVANLIRSRLEASGRVRVLDAARVSQRVGPDGAAGASEAELRALARDLGSGFVVSGSLTELAGRYSLDVRVTSAAPAQPGHTLVVTADREDELLTRVNELADRVLGEVVGVAPSRVVAVEIVGADQLESELRGRLQTRAGEPYDPVAVRDDLAALRSDPDVANASVETERGPDGVVVRFAVITSERILAELPAGVTAKRVDEVVVRGNRRIEADAIRARIGTTPGGPYRPSQIAKDVREIYALGFFRNVRVLTEKSPKGGRIVIFEVEENPVVRQISISGNDNVDGEKIRDILTLTMGSALDYPLLFENRARIQALYKAQGYYLAEVDYEIETLSPASVGIHFIVTENEKLKLRDIQFIGNEAFSDRELREGFQTKKWRFWSYASSWFDRSGTYSEPLFIQDLRSVEKKYTDAGYLQVEISPPDVIASVKGLVVSVTINEAEQFRVGALDVAGDSTVDIDTLRDKLLLREGEIFNRSYLTEDVAVLTQHYTDRGFYFANVSPLSNLSKADQTVDVIFQVRKGPLYFIRNVNIDGNTITVDPVIRREIPIVEGELYSQREILISKSRVQSLGFFEEVDFQVQPTDEPDQIDLDVRVVERPTGSFSFGAGYSSQDSFVVTGSLSQDNLFGRGYAARFSADFGASTQRFFFSLSDPYFLGTDFSLGVTIFNTSMNFEDFEQEQTGADFVLGHTLTEDNRTRGYVRYSWASRSVTDDQNVNAASVILRELIQDELTSSLVGLSVSSDTRNDRLSPTSGYTFAASLDFAGLGFFSKFLRAEASGAWYLGAPWWLLDDSTFVVSGRIGYVLPLNSISDFDFPTDSDGNLFQGIDTADGNVLPLQDIDDDLKLPLSERYFLGGLGEYQLRGFKARSVGPRRAILRPATPIDPDLRDAFGSFIPVGRRVAWVSSLNPDKEVAPGSPFAVPGTVCDDTGSFFGNGNGECNDISDTDIDDFEDLDETDVIGGNKFISTSLEYRFPISEAIGLQGLVFFDMGNAFYEGQNLFDVGEWRYGTGAGVQWFSPFGPLAVILGFPLDALEDEDSLVFEFSVGGQGF